MNEKVLFEKKISAHISNSYYRVEFLGFFYPPAVFASWPFAQIRLYNDNLSINLLGKNYVLKYDDIDCIEKKTWYVKIKHHSKKIDKYVAISDALLGSNLFKELKAVIQKNSLPVKVKE